MKEHIITRAFLNGESVQGRGYSVTINLDSGSETSTLSYRGIEVFRFTIDEESNVSQLAFFISTPKAKTSINMAFKAFGLPIKIGYMKGISYIYNEKNRHFTLVRCDRWNEVSQFYNTRCPGPVKDLINLAIFRRRDKGISERRAA